LARNCDRAVECQADEGDTDDERADASRRSCKRIPHGFVL